MRKNRPSGPPRRRPSSDAIRLELLVFVEGRRTEEQYIIHWFRRHRDRVLVTVDGYRGGPLQLVDRAIRTKQEQAREARRGRGRPHDQIWCLFDRDEHPNFDKALELARENGINVAVSNPCIELWFLLHFEDQTGHLDRHEAQRRAEAHLRCGKSLDDTALTLLEARADDAKERAIGLEAKHRADDSPVGKNPSSTVWRLVDVIRHA